MPLQSKVDEIASGSRSMPVSITGSGYRSYSPIQMLNEAITTRELNVHCRGRPSSMSQAEAQGLGVQVSIETPAKIRDGKLS